jgi:hypothetical protein
MFQCRKRKKKANKQASDIDCALQTIYLSEASAKEQLVMHDLTCGNCVNWASSSCETG